MQRQGAVARQSSGTTHRRGYDQRCGRGGGCRCRRRRVYQLDGGYGYRPTPAEQEHYYRTVLEAIDHPVAFSIHSFSGFLAPIPMLKRLVDDYPHLQVFNLMGIPINYYVEVTDAIGPRLEYFVGVRQIMEGLPLGAAGFMAAEPNIAPSVLPPISEHYARGDHDAFATSLRRPDPADHDRDALGAGQCPLDQDGDEGARPAGRQRRPAHTLSCCRARRIRRK